MYNVNVTNRGGQGKMVHRKEDTLEQKRAKEKWDADWTAGKATIWHKTKQMINK